MQTKSKKTNKNKNTKYFVHLNEPSTNIPEFEFITPETFTKKIKNNSCAEIFIGDLFDYMSLDDISNFLDTIISKLSDKGKIMIQSVDARSLCYSFAIDQADLNLFNAMAYGNGKQRLSTLSQIRNIVNTKNQIKVQKIKFINGINFYIECEKL